MEQGGDQAQKKSKKTLDIGRENPKVVTLYEE